MKNIEQIVNEAKQAAYNASSKYFNEVLGGRDQFACGFAWVNIYGVKGNTKEGREFKRLGIRKDYQGGLCMWNPASFPCQNVDTLLEGAEAAAEVFRKNGFKAYASSRLD